MLARMFVAFDVDNTLLDPDMRAYRETVTRFLETADIGLPQVNAYDAFEEARGTGHALERLGLRSPIHDRGNADGLAVFWLAFCTNAKQRQELGIDEARQVGFREALSDLARLDKQARKGAFDSRLVAEHRCRSLCTTDERLQRLAADATRLAGHSLIMEASRRFKSIEDAQPVANKLALMKTLASRGLHPIIITEGRTAIQEKKVQRIGLGKSWHSRVLITEETGRVAGVRELDQVISALMDAESADIQRPPTADLASLWQYRCLIEEWAGKTPSFFARCLHAIQQSPDAPRTAIQPPAYFSKKDWQPLNFVMIGDRYDKDVEPLIDLLGPGVGMKIRLRMGKYGHLHPEDSLVRDRRPDRTFTDWDSLAHFLTEELTPEQVPPITTPPDIADRRYVTRELIEFGLKSELEAVRTVAVAFEMQMGDAP